MAFPKSVASALLFTAAVAVLATLTMAKANDLRIMDANARFAKDVYKVLAKQPGNVFFSPISAHTVLSLVYQGAEGETSKRMAKVLRLPNKKSSADGYHTVLQKLKGNVNVTLHFANKAYVMSGYKLNKSFTEIAAKSFFSKVGEMDFGNAVPAAFRINAWVATETDYKIENLMSPDQLNEETRLLLINAIYFKGRWKTEFKEADTKKQPFHVRAGEKIDVDMMHVTSWFRYDYSDKLDAQILEMPYHNRDLSMLFILPSERDGIKKLEKKLAGADLMRLTYGLYGSDVEVSLPKFKIETTVQFKSVLQKLGLNIIFDERKANLSGLLDNAQQYHDPRDNLYVSDIVQKTYLVVNEKGVEAAAATVSGSGHGTHPSPPPPPIRVFLADHPFLIALIFRNTPLFFGRIERV